MRRGFALFLILALLLPACTSQPASAPLASANTGASQQTVTATPRPSPSDTAIATPKAVPTASFTPTQIPSPTEPPLPTRWDDPELLASVQNDFFKQVGVSSIDEMTTLLQDDPKLPKDIWMSGYWGYGTKAPQKRYLTRGLMEFVVISMGVKEIDIRSLGLPYDRAGILYGLTLSSTWDEPKAAVVPVLAYVKSGSKMYAPGVAIDHQISAISEEQIPFIKKPGSIFFVEIIGEVDKAQSNDAIREELAAYFKYFYCENCNYGNVIADLLTVSGKYTLLRDKKEPYSEIFLLGNLKEADDGAPVSFGFIAEGFGLITKYPNYLNIHKSAP